MHPATVEPIAATPNAHSLENEDVRQKGRLVSTRASFAGSVEGSAIYQSHPSYQGSQVQSGVGRLTPLSDKDGGRLDVDENYGRPRFYGPTSQQYIQRRNLLSDSETMIAPSEPVEELNINTGPLRALLFQTFWKLQPNSVIVVEEALFQIGRDAGTRSEYYSAFLENSLLACATRMSTSEGVRRLGPRYADLAKAEIAQELE